MRSLRAAVITFLFLLLFCCAASTAMTNEETLALVSKDPKTWQIATSGPTLLLTFNRDLGTFYCAGKGLEPRQGYALIQHDSSDPRGRGFIVAVATSTTNGALQLAGQWSRWRGKVWLVLADDVQGCAADKRLDQLIDWQPKRYLFESRPLL